MNCHNHPLRQGIHTCFKCGHWLCDECSKDREGRLYCKDCLVGKGAVSTHYAIRVPNALLLILFSVLPGANYMYMGLIKRGLFVLTAFFMSIYLAGFFNFFGFVIPCVVITSFFDGLRLRRKWIAGEPISDDINDLKAFFAANKMPLIVVAGLLVVVEVLQKAVFMLNHGARQIFYYGNALPNILIAIAAIALGIYFLSKLRKSKTPVDRNRDLQ